MNRGELKLRVARILGIATGTSDDAVDEDELLNQLAEEAVIDILTRTRINVSCAEMTLVDGTSEFDVDGKLILRIQRFQRGENWLEEQPLDSLDSNGYAWLGLNRFRLGAPASGSEQLHAWFTPTPSPMLADTDDPALAQFGRIPANYHRAILNYMCWHTADMAGDTQVGRGERYRVYYEGQDGMAGPGSDLGRIKNDTNHRSGGTRVRRARELLNSDYNGRYYS